MGSALSAEADAAREFRTRITVLEGTVEDHRRRLHEHEEEHEKLNDEVRDLYKRGGKLDRQHDGLGDDLRNRINALEFKPNPADR